MTGVFRVNVVQSQSAWGAATLLACGMPASLAAQETTVPPVPTPNLSQEQNSIEGEPSRVGSAQQIEFEADAVDYDSTTDRITARGDVILRNDQASVRADSVVWDRAAGTISASGAVRFVDKAGNQIFTETVELNDAFEAGAMDEL